MFFLWEEAITSQKTIAGPNIYICNECVTFVMTYWLKRKNLKPDQSFQIAKPKEIYTLLDEIVVGQDEAKRKLSLLFIIITKNHNRTQPMPLKFKKAMSCCLDQQAQGKLCWLKP